MKVFVTGATGFIGYHTVRALLEAGHSVRLGVRNEKKMRDLYEPLGIDTSDHATGEITDKAAIDAALEGCDGVVHTAAMVSLDPNLAEQTYHTNVTGTRLVVGGAVAQGIRAIVHVSSAAALFDPHLRTIDENTPLAAQSSAYGRSKVDSERHVQGLIDDGARVAITYPGGVLGPDDPAMSEGNQGLALFFKLGVLRTSGGLQSIDVRDLAIAHLRLLDGQKCGRYPIAGHYRSWDEIGHILDRVTGRKVRKIPAPAWLLRGIGKGVDLAGRFVTLDTPISNEAVDYATRWVYVDDRRIREELALEFRPLEVTFADTIRWLAATGEIDPWWAGRLDR